MTHTTHTERLAARPGQTRPWVVQCAGCPWASAEQTHEDAEHAGTAHREAMGR